MGVTAAWGISVHEDAMIGELAARFRPVVEAERADPDNRRRWAQWQRAPLPDHRTWLGGLSDEQVAAIDSFVDLTFANRRVEDACFGTGEEQHFSIYDVWGGQPAEEFFFSAFHKDCAVTVLFHAIGPERASLLPGWCGNFVLTSDEVRRSLPLVERALAFSPAERAAADARDWLSYDDTEENVIDGPLRVWRLAATTGRGLCGVATRIY